MQNIKNIKNIIFDIGEVLLTINKLKATEALIKLGINNENLANMLEKESGDYFRYEQGLISTAEFRDFFRKKSSQKFSDLEFDAAWNEMLIDFPRDRINILQQLKHKFNLYILSNTNDIHINYFNSILQDKFGIENMKQLVDKAYYSNEIKYRKPDPKIYEYVLNDSKLVAENTLFIDDRLENLEAAEIFGIKTLHFTGEQSFGVIFKDYLQ